MRTHMLKFFEKHYKATLLKDANSDVMGSDGKEVETRIMYDLEMVMNDVQHKCKIKVYNTNCEMDFQGLNGDVLKRHNHLNNKTVGRYLAENVVPDLLQRIVCEEEIDIQKLNILWKKQAQAASKIMKKNEVCKKCEAKPKRNQKILNCKKCKEITHLTCIKSSEKYSSATAQLNYECRDCVREIEPKDTAEKSVIDPDKSNTNKEDVQIKELHVEDHSCSECLIKDESIKELEASVSSDKQ